MKKIRHDKGGIGKIMVIFVVAILVICGIGAFMFTNAGDDDVTASATIYIQEPESGKTWSGEIDLGKPSTMEQAMLAFGDEVRTTELKPMGFSTDMGTISEFSEYIIWAVVKVKVDATADFESLTSIQVDLTGIPGEGSGTATATPDHKTNTDGKSYLSNAVAGNGASIIKNSGLAFGTEYTFDQSSSSFGKYTNIRWWDSTNSRYNLIALKGTHVDGAKITANIIVTAVDGTGASVVKTAKADLLITVSAWSASSLSITITGFGGSK